MTASVTEATASFRCHNLARLAAIADDSEDG